MTNEFNLKNNCAPEYENLFSKVLRKLSKEKLDKLYADYELHCKFHGEIPLEIDFSATPPNSISPFLGKSITTEEQIKMFENEDFEIAGIHIQQSCKTKDNSTNRNVISFVLKPIVKEIPTPETGNEERQ